MHVVHMDNCHWEESETDVGRFVMPSHETFSMKPIRELLESKVPKEGLGIDPFARRRHGFATVYNDANPDCDVDYHEDAIDFLRRYEDDSVDWVLYDPPYSLRQLKECYDGVGRAMTQHESQKFFSDIKKEIVRILRPGGIVISFGWNSGGVGQKALFERLVYMSLYHGGVHNNTIVTVDRKKVTE